MKCGIPCIKPYLAYIIYNFNNYFNGKGFYLKQYLYDPQSDENICYGQADDENNILNQDFPHTGYSVKF